MLKRFVLALFFLLAAAPSARAEYYYYTPAWDNLVKTLIRFGALDVSDNAVLDEYAIVTDCDIYRTFTGNDLRWNQIRDKIRQSITMNMEKFPANYAYQDKLALDHYDFQSQMYHFNDHNPLQKVNAFFLYRTNGFTCGDIKVKYIPRAFRAILDESVSLPGLPLTPKSADALLRRMDANNNKDRFVYVRFNLHINYISKVDKNTRPGNHDTVYTQHNASSDDPVLLNAQVDSIDFYEDARYTKLIWSYQP